MKKPRSDGHFWIACFLLITLIFLLNAILTDSAESNILTPVMTTASLIPKEKTDLKIEEAAGESSQGESLSVEDRIKRIVMMRVEVARICQEIIEHSERSKP